MSIEINEIPSERIISPVSSYTAMDLADVSRIVADGMELDVLVSPGSDRSGIEGFDEWRKRLVVRVRAPPSDGKANKEVEALMKRVTGCRSEIIRGHLNRQKTVMIYGDSVTISKVLEARP